MRRSLHAWVLAEAKKPVRQGRLSRACRTRQWRPHYRMLAWVSLWPRGSWWSAWRGPSGKTTSSLVRSSAPCLALCASRSISVPTAGRVRGRFGPPLSKIGAGAGLSFPGSGVTAISLRRNGYWERRTPVRRGLCATRTAGVICEIAPHWGAALPGRTGSEVYPNGSDGQAHPAIVHRRSGLTRVGRPCTVRPRAPPAIIAPEPGGWRTPVAARCRPARRAG